MQISVQLAADGTKSKSGGVRWGLAGRILNGGTCLAVTYRRYESERRIVSESPKHTAYDGFYGGLI